MVCSTGVRAGGAGSIPRIDFAFLTGVGHLNFFVQPLKRGATMGLRRTHRLQSSEGSGDLEMDVI